MEAGSARGGGTPQDFISSRGGHQQGAGAPNLNPEFAARMAAAGRAYEQETGQRAQFGETGRSREQQQKYYDEFKRTGQGLAAKPGTSLHERGIATDVPTGPFQTWLHQNARRFGIQGLRDPRDPFHFQMDNNYKGSFAQGGQNSGGNVQNLSNYTRALINIESGGNPRNRTGSNYGLGQFSRDQYRHFGLNRGNQNDPRAQTRAIQQEANENAGPLRQTLGRDPTPAELYIAHQQGLAGARALMQNPDTPAWQAVRRFYGSDAIAQRAIRGNIPSNNALRAIPIQNITAGQFVRMWTDRFNRELPTAANY